MAHYLREKMNIVQEWFLKNGDNTFSITHELNENSIVIDLGAYKGIWADKIIKKYNPNLFLIEPINEFCEILKEKYKNNQKIIIVNKGISSLCKKEKIFIDNDSSSVYKESKNFIYVDFITIDKLLEVYKINKIDLLQINIEGEEYQLLENILTSEVINKINCIQVQFHDFIKDADLKRKMIQELFIEKNFKKQYDFPFVWECWKKI